MKTILLISPYWKEHHRWMVSSVKLAELWQRLGYRVVVVCMGPRPPCPPTPDPSPEGRGGSEAIGRTHVEKVSDTLTIYRMRDIFLKDPWNYGIAFGFARFVGKIVKEEKPDRIVINKLLFWTSLAGIRLRLAGRKFLLLTDALVGITWWPRGRLPKLGAFLYAWTLGWLLLLLADRVVTFHPQPPALLRKLMIARKTTVIPTGIDPAPYGKHQFPSTNDQLTVTYIGRLESVKGVEDFLAAAVPIKEEIPPLHIQVVGWFKKGNPLVLRYMDQVTFTGLRDDIPAILSGTDIFVLPSHSEGLSNALMEAMASGCACVASDVGGNGFLLQNGISGLRSPSGDYGRQAGFLFPPGDRQALAAHIRRLIADPAKRKSLGEAARQRIGQVFSWDVVGRAYRQLFEVEKNATLEMHRIVILSAFLTPFRSGAEACAEEVPKALKETYEFTIVTAKLRRDLPRRDSLSLGSSPGGGGGHRDVEVIRVGLGIPWDKWLFPFLAPFVVRRIKPQAIHAVLESYAGLALVLCRFIVPRAKRVLTQQSTNTSFLLSLMYRSAHALTAISRTLVTRSEHYGRKDVRHIPNGVPYASIRETCGRIQKVPGRILFAGRLEPMKGVDTLLQALHLLWGGPPPPPPSPRGRGAFLLTFILSVMEAGGDYWKCNPAPSSPRGRSGGSSPSPISTRSTRKRKSSSASRAARRWGTFSWKRRRRDAPWWRRTWAASPT